jgi:hypothetical protein
VLHYDLLYESYGSVGGAVELPAVASLGPERAQAIF